MHLHDISQTKHFGVPLSRAQRAVVLLHGRGSSAEDIAGLADALTCDTCAFVAPSAEGGTWYPQRFLAPITENEPWLSSALTLVDQLVTDAIAAGLPSDRIGLIGFSQGGCLALEYAARHPRRYAFVAGLSGALIGPLNTTRPPGDLRQTPVLLGCAERDAHIPIEFVESSAATFNALNAEVTKQIYRGSAHTVFPQEIDWLKARS